MSAPQRNAAPRWLPLAAAALGTVVATTGPLSGTAAAYSSALCEGASTRVDVAWPACATHAGDSAVPPQHSRLTALATTVRQPSLAVGPQPSGQSTTTYRVRFGDCLSDIATSHNIADWQQLYAVNRRGISNPDLIYPGQLLRLPATQAPQ